MPAHDTNGSNDILAFLSDQQYLHPHASLKSALLSAGEVIGFCDGAAAAALRRLKLTGGESIGRLTHTQLMQLAIGVQEAWENGTDPEAPRSPPPPVRHFAPSH